MNSKQRRVWYKRSKHSTKNARTMIKYLRTREVKKKRKKQVQNHQNELLFCLNVLFLCCIALNCGLHIAHFFRLLFVCCLAQFTRFSHINIIRKFVKVLEAIFRCAFAPTAIYQNCLSIRYESKPTRWNERKIYKRKNIYLAVVLHFFLFTFVCRKTITKLYHIDKCVLII